MLSLSERIRNYAVLTYVDQPNDRIPLLLIADKIKQLEEELREYKAEIERRDDAINK